MEKARLLAWRSSDFLRWHYHPAPSGKDITFICVYSGNRLGGYAVVLNEQNENSGLARTKIIDLIAENDHPKIIDALLRGCMEHAQKCRSHVLEMPGFPHCVRSGFMAWRPYVRRLSYNPYLYLANGIDFGKKLKDGDLWYVCEYDGDASFL